MLTHQQVEVRCYQYQVGLLRYIEAVQSYFVSNMGNKFREHSQSMTELAL